MKSYRRIAILLCSLSLSCPVLSPAQTDTSTAKPADLTSRLEELQRELDDVRAQLAALKEAPAHPASSTPAATSSLASSSSSSSLASLLGPTTLSGFVDMYYGYNANQPVNRSSSF